MDSKICNTCKEPKLRTLFGKQSSERDGLRASCKRCINTAQNKSNRNNPERRAAHSKRYQDNNRDAVLARRVLNKEADSIRGKLWVKANRARVNEKAANRRARVREQTPDMCDMEVSMIRAMYWISDVLSNSCGESFHIDHIHPISKGGLHEFANLQILSAEENFKKGAKV